MKAAKQTPCSCGSGKPYAQCCGQAAPVSPPPEEVNMLIVLYNDRRYAELESRARTLIERFPNFGFGWQLLGGALKMQGKDALHAFQRTAELQSDDAEAHFNLGVVQKGLGQLEAAAASYRRTVAIEPDYSEAHSNLGNVLKDLGQLDEAVDSYRRALTIKPDSAYAHNSLGTALKDLGQTDNAIASYRRALEIKPNYAEAHYNLGNALKEIGQFESAAESYRLAVKLKSDFADAHTNLGAVLQVLGQSKPALESYCRALEIKPDNAEMYMNLGGVLQDLGRHDEAADNYRRALKIEPDFAEAYNNLGNALINIMQLDEAITSCRLALKFKPDLALAHNSLLFCLSNSETVDAETLYAEHCRFGEQFETLLLDRIPQHSNSRNPARCLQVGFVSGDLRKHAVASFIEPVLASLARNRQLSLHAYYNHTIEDEVTRRLRGYLAHWHPIAGLPDEALAQKISEDSIDILIDLSGHTGKNRLLTFARKPAPVQASWMGYPGTTGLHAMDYYLADRFFLPPGQFENQFTEKIVRLPANAPFMPSQAAPPVNALPAMNNGYMTFGSFNRPSKISRSVIAQWSQLLRALPDSRMLMAGMPEEGKYGTLIEWFAQEGIASDRLDFHARSDMPHYLALHHQVDICLDTFPYNGGTTTLHALWMGIPTLTLLGHTAASRQGASILGHAGLEAFVARDAADFAQKGLSWAGNLAALSDIRTRLRERFARSAMGQPALVAAGLERALRIMWQRWCEGLTPADIDVSENQTAHETFPLEIKISGNPGNQGR